MSDTRDMLSVDRTASGDAARDDVRATLDAWRAAGAGRIDPLRFAMIDALAQRVSELRSDGELRRLLEGRLAALIAAYARDVEAMHEDREDREGQPTQSAQPAFADSGAAALSALAAASGARGARADTLADTLEYLQTTWSKLSAGRQLRQSLAQVPGNAGPLNSSRLVHRALSLMNELSPDYLRHFLVYAETLSALGELAGGTQPSAPSVESASRGKGAKQSGKRKPKGG